MTIQDYEFNLLTESERKARVILETAVCNAIQQYERRTGGHITRIKINQALDSKGELRTKSVEAFL